MHVAHSTIEYISIGNFDSILGLQVVAEWLWMLNPLYPSGLTHKEKPVPLRHPKIPSENLTGIVSIPEPITLDRGVGGADWLNLGHMT